MKYRNITTIFSLFIFYCTCCGNTTDKTIPVETFESSHTDCDSRGNTSDKIMPVETAQSDAGDSTIKVKEQANPAEGTKTIVWNSKWKYAEYAVIHSDPVKLYRSTAPKRKNKTVAVNAGHGTKGGASKKVQCHPDGSPKCVSGSTKAGAKTAAAVASGMTFVNGTPESVATLKIALKMKDMLLSEGYDVLMIRENADCQLDNVARTVFANNNADIHIAIHFDGTKNNKGAFYVGVPQISSYLRMEPVASNWQKHEQLGKCLNQGMKEAGVKIYGRGYMAIDLTQTSFSTIPSIDYESGDAASDISDKGLTTLARGFVNGINHFFSK